MRGWRTALGVRIYGRIRRWDRARDVILERLDREVGQGDLVVAVLPGSSSSRAHSPSSRSSAPKPCPGLSPIATP
jgi:hypothetical protein